MTKEKEDRFAHWDTEPVPVKHAYVPEDYDIFEWEIKQAVDRAGDEMFTQSSGLDFSEFDYLGKGEAKN